MCAVTLATARQIQRQMTRQFIKIGSLVQQLQGNKRTDIPILYIHAKNINLSGFSAVG